MRSRFSPFRAAAFGCLALLSVLPGCTPPSGPDLVIASIEVFGNAEVTVGSSIQLHTIRKNADGFTIDAPGNITWISSDPLTATIGAQSGIVTGVKAGSVTITASSGSVNGFKTVGVKPLPPAPVNTV